MDIWSKIEKDERSLKQVLVESGVTWAPIMVLLLDEKGGVGKSTLAQLVVQMLRRDHANVIVAETDTSNSSQTMIGSARILDARAAHGIEGELFSLAEEMASGAADAVVVDFGARDERASWDFLAGLANAVVACGGRLVIARPITVDAEVIDNAATFVETVATRDMHILLLRNLAMADGQRSFAKWEQSETRRALSDAGCIEVVIDNFDRSQAARARSLRLSIEEAAFAAFDVIKDRIGEPRSESESKAERDERLGREAHQAQRMITDAKEFFSRPVQLRLLRLLLSNHNKIRDGLAKLICARAV